MKKALRLKFFLRKVHTNPLFKDCNVLKFHKIALENSIFIINLLNINFPKHLITGLDFRQILIPTRRGRIWAVLMYLLTELNYMEDICLY